MCNRGIEAGSHPGGFGSVVRIQGKRMTQEEALNILNFVDNSAPKAKDPAEIMKQFEKLYASNNPAVGGSLYFQTKIYFAKEHLMKGFPPELNKSRFNPTPEGASSEKTTQNDKHNTTDGI